MKSIKIGVVSDRHVPDRLAEIPQSLLTRLKDEKVELILHGGDICVPAVLAEFEKIAPVNAVKGNRDILFDQKLPMIYSFEQFGVKFALMHGHINFMAYWLDKVQYIFQGYRRSRYCGRLPKAFSGAKVYVYGHSHHAECFWMDQVLYFNPGSVSYGDPSTRRKTWGILEVFEDGRVEGRIIPCE